MIRRTSAPSARALVARAVGASLTVAVAVALAACGGGAPNEGDGAPPSSPSPSPDASAPPETGAPAADADSGGAGAPAPAAPSPPADIPIVDATGVVAPAALGTPPTGVRLDDLDLDMPVLPVGIAADGQTEVPGDANDAGWYRFGPGAGSDRGATVILAHAGTEETPRGPFSRLKDVDLGAAVSVTDDAGVEHAYVVTDVEVLEKATLDLTPYFVRDGDPRLVLITCGGQWDEEANSYRSNVVVTAVPA
ncbi:class F sortase [Serinibacter arcticus]|uniref:Putative secreted protein n=1 Tax=Serinibacter arcticus TaxID=1655435 RepID=A0A4Z1E2Z9_9MICO|nr:class F sortase [Serinibacter arcticus]TGO05112.1 putative secreted protein [Serinibacter arcticus]